MNAETLSLIVPDSFECSNERKEERSEYASTSSVMSNTEVDIMINSDSFEQSYDLSENNTTMSNQHLHLAIGLGEMLQRNRQELAKE